MAIAQKMLVGVVLLLQPPTLLQPLANCNQGLLHIGNHEGLGKADDFFILSPHQHSESQPPRILDEVPLTISKQCLVLVVHHLAVLQEVLGYHRNICSKIKNSVELLGHGLLDVGVLLHNCRDVVESFNCFCALFFFLNAL